MTSDHRVAGSSHVGCKTSMEADPQTIGAFKIPKRKRITCQSFATFAANPLCDSLAGKGATKPKQWPVSDRNDKFITYRYEAPADSGSRLWIELRFSEIRQKYTALGSNAFDNGKTWLLLSPPQKNHAVAKRRAFEMIAAWTTVPVV